MKKYLVIFTTFVSLLATYSLTTAQSPFLERVKSRIKNKVEQRAINKIDKK